MDHRPSGAEDQLTAGEWEPGPPASTGEPPAVPRPPGAAGSPAGPDPGTAWPPAQPPAAHQPAQEGLLPLPGAEREPGVQPAGVQPAGVQPAGAEPGPPAPAEPGGQPRPRRAVGPFPQPRTIALANQKGGVGKTTTALSLGACLAESGKRVLLVDFDPQGGCGIGLGLNPHAMELTVYNLLLQEGVSARDVLVKTAIPGLELIPSNIDLAAAELLLVQEVAREQALRRALQPLQGLYDFTLIDCPPSLGLLTVNALTAADTVIIPLECEYFALRGMSMLLDTVRKVQDRLNPQLQVEGILATMYDARTLHSREVLERVREAFGELVFHTVIPKTIRFAEAPVAGEPITTYAPGSPGADGYRSLTEEVLSP